MDNKTKIFLKELTSSLEKDGWSTIDAWMFDPDNVDVSVDGQDAEIIQRYVQSALDKAELIKWDGRK